MNQDRWLSSCLLSASQDVSEEALCYVSARGLPSALALEMQVGLWDHRRYHNSPDKTFSDRYGPTGSNVHNFVSIPIWAPSGRLVGVEWRRWDGEKSSLKYFLPNSKWEPAFIGMTPSVLNKIQKGGDVWLVEGVFDLAICHALPKGDVALACGGAKVTDLQLNLLSRFVRREAQVHVCFDMDETGRNMANGYIHPDTGKKVWGVSERLTLSGVRNRVVSYCGGKDPGEIWENGGKSLLVAKFGFFTQVLNRLDTSNPDMRSPALGEL